MRAAAGRPWRVAAGSLVVRVRLTPKSSIDAVDGVTATADGAAFKARVRALPSEGEANAALERLVSEWLGVPKSAVQVMAGGKARVKLLSVAGDTDMLEQRLEAELARLVRGQETKGRD